MPECETCGASVPRRYVQVFTPRCLERPRVCPACRDRVDDEPTGRADR